MRVLDVECTENPVNIKKFDIIDEKNFPYIFLGVEIKNEYDQQRFVFDKRNDIKNVVHFSSHLTPSTKFFRGIPLTVNFNLIKLVEKINLHKEALSNTIPLAMYKSILKEYGLTCENSAASLCEDVFPVDGECVDIITNNEVKLSDQYEFLFHNKKIPYYQSVGYLSIFIIDNSGANNNKKTFKNLLYLEKNMLAKNK
jgi:hypothetical protein